MKKSMPEVVEQLAQTVEERYRAEPALPGAAAAGVECRRTYGRWSREVRCEDRRGPATVTG